MLKYIFGSGTFGLALALSAAAFTSLAFWLKEEFKPEPLFTLFIFLIAVLTGSELFRAIKEARAKSKSLPLESYEDPTTAVWGVTNHSRYEITWNSETNIEHLNDLRKIWREQCTWCNYSPSQDLIVYLKKLLLLTIVFFQLAAPDS